MKSMTTRERCLAVLNFQPFDRLPIIEWADWWQATMDRWHQDGGLPATMTDCNEIRRHFDKMTMNKGEAAMRAEFERLLPTAAKGGFIISCDHQTPPAVSYEDYKLYIRLFREYAERAGKLSQST